jgi:hypothetical protein
LLLCCVQQEQWGALYGHWCGFGHYRLVYLTSAVAIYVALGTQRCVYKWVYIEMGSTRCLCRAGVESII